MRKVWFEPLGEGLSFTLTKNAAKAANSFPIICSSRFNLCWQIVTGTRIKSQWWMVSRLRLVKPIGAIGPVTSTHKNLVAVGNRTDKCEFNTRFTVGLNPLL